MPSNDIKDLETFCSMLSLFNRLKGEKMQRCCRDTYLSTNRVVQAETGKQHGDNCRRWKHVGPGQSKKNSGLMREKRQGV